tara:strand:- start:2508 stop:3218 length:711 start_codon:yes stop_codon:yes gene_type:complete
VHNYGTCDRISPEAPVLILKIEKTESRPGMASNVLHALQRLGNKPSIITNSEKITKERYVCSKSMQHVLRVDRGENTPISSLDPKAVSLADYDCLVISDYNKGFLPHTVCKELVDHAISENKSVFVDTKKTDLSCFAGCFIKLNQLEYERAKSFPTKSEVITTLGPMGARHGGKNYPTNKTEVFDVCGAGDSFLAAFVTSYMSFHNIPAAIHFANKVATISVQNFGNYTPTLGELG